MRLDNTVSRIANTWVPLLQGEWSIYCYGEFKVARMALSFLTQNQGPPKSAFFQFLTKNTLVGGGGRTYPPKMGGPRNNFPRRLRRRGKYALRGTQNHVFPGIFASEVHKNQFPAQISASEVHKDEFPQDFRVRGTTTFSDSRARSQIINQCKIK